MNMDEYEQYNRLFILGGKGCTEEDWRSSFSKFGDISNVQLVADRKTGEQKGAAVRKCRDACHGDTGCLSKMWTIRGCHSVRGPWKSCRIV